MTNPTATVVTVTMSEDGVATNVALSDADVERIAQRCAQLVAERLRSQALTEQEVEDTEAEEAGRKLEEWLAEAATLPDDEEEEVAEEDKWWNKEPHPPVEPGPYPAIVVEPCSRIGDHLRVAKLLRERRHPLNSRQIGSQLGLQPSDVTLSLQYLKRHELAEQPRGIGTQDWAATPTLRTHGLVAA